MSDVTRWLSTVRGQLELLGLTLGAAVGIAVLLAAQRDFFLRYVGEKYGPATATAEVQAQALERAEVVRPLGDAEAEALYELWVQAAEPRPQLAKRLVAAAPQATARRLERTFAAGSRAQRERAVAFAEVAASPALVPVLSLAARRAEAVRDDALAARLRAAIVSEPGPR